MRHPVAWTLVPLTLVLGAPDCDPPPPPKMVSFSVSHDVVCPGESVTVSWEVSNAVPLLYAGESQAEILAAWKNDDLSPFTVDGPTGSKAFVITEPVTFGMRAYRNDETYDDSEAFAVQLVPTEPLVGTFEACEGGPWSTWAVTGNWTETAVTTHVDNLNDRALTLTHQGQTLTITPSSPDPVPPLPMAGPWTASVELLPGEGCPSSSSVMDPGPPPVDDPPDLSAGFVFTCP